MSCCVTVVYYVTQYYAGDDVQRHDDAGDARPLQEVHAGHPPNKLKITIYIYIYIDIYRSLSLSLYIYIITHVHIHVHTVRLSVCVCIYIYIYTYIPYHIEHTSTSTTDNKRQTQQRSSRRTPTRSGQYLGWSINIHEPPTTIN